MKRRDKGRAERAERVWMDSVCTGMWLGLLVLGILHETTHLHSSHTTHYTLLFGPSRLPPPSSGSVVHRGHVPLRRRHLRSSSGRRRLRAAGPWWADTLRRHPRPRGPLCRREWRVAWACSGLCRPCSSSTCHRSWRGGLRVARATQARRDRARST